MSHAAEARVFFDNDGNLGDLAGLRVAIIGYGNQGKSHA